MGIKILSSYQAKHIEMLLKTFISPTNQTSLKGKYPCGAFYAVNVQVQSLITAVQMKIHKTVQIKCKWRPTASFLLP